MSRKFAYHNYKDGLQQPGSPGISYLVGCILNGHPVRALILRVKDVLACDTVTVCVDPSSTPKAVSALLPIQAAMKESCD